jgi:hypothetical protein
LVNFSLNFHTILKQFWDHFIITPHDELKEN